MIEIFFENSFAITNKTIWQSSLQFRTNFSIFFCTECTSNSLNHLLKWDSKCWKLLPTFSIRGNIVIWWSQIGRNFKEEVSYKYLKFQNLYLIYLPKLTKRVFNVFLSNLLKTEFKCFKMLESYILYDLNQIQYFLIYLRKIFG